MEMMMGMLFNWDTNFKKPALRKFLLLFTAAAFMMLLIPRAGFSIDVLDSFQFEDRWPKSSVDNLAYNAGRNELYLANGNFITVLNAGAGTFEEISRLKIEISQDSQTVQVGRGITGIADDPESAYVYAACGAQGIAVVNVSDPVDPVKAVLSEASPGDSEDNPIHASDVDYLDNRLYVADVYFGLRIVNVDTPTNPYQTGVYEQTADGQDTETETASGGHINVYTKIINNEKFAFVLDQYYGLRIFNVDDDTTSHVSSFDMRARFYWGQYSEVVDVVVDSPYAYVTDLTYGVTILNFSGALSGSTPEISNVGQIETPGTASGLALSGDNTTLFVADGNQGMLAANVSNPEAAIDDSDGRGSLAFPDSLVQEQSYAASGSYAVLASIANVYLATGAEGLTWLQQDTGLLYSQVSDSNNPYDPPADTTALYAEGEYAYISDNDGPIEGLRILNLAGPESGRAELRGFVPTPGDANAVAVNGSFAYVADGTEGVAVINIENKTAPLIDSTFDPGGNFRDIAFWEQDGSVTAYIADSGAGRLRISEVNQSTGALTEIGSHPLTNVRATTIYAREETDGIHTYAALVNGAGLTIVDVTDPTTPVGTGSLDTTGDARDVAVTHPYAVVADGSNGVLLVDISDPNNPPTLLDSYSTAEPAEAISLYASYIHTAVGSRGVAVIGISETDPVELTPIDIDPDQGTESPYYNTPGYASSLIVSEMNEQRYTYVADDHGGFLSLLHDDDLREGINEQPFTESPDDSARIECFITTLF
ncbi:MAG: hypothetical protein K9K82_11205 [Desulfobacteraceae bacterium]|nr:hypothetical protein [Desulfobacteraceae bacterium]